MRDKRPENNMSENVAKEYTGSDWYASTGSFKPALPQVADCAAKDIPKFASNKELSKFIRARLAKQGYRG
jgi:hypothetical protein